MNNSFKINGDDTSDNEINTNPQPNPPTINIETINAELSLTTNNDNQNDNLQLTDIEENILLQDDNYESDTELDNLTQITPNRPRLLYTPNDNDETEQQNNTIDMDTTAPNNTTFETTEETPTTYDIPPNLHASFQTLNSLKHTRNRTNTTIEKLTNHKTDDTLPTGLQAVTHCNIILDDDHRKRWVQASRDASKQQLDILVEHHKRKLETIQLKIEHVTNNIHRNSTTNDIAEKILTTTDHISNKYTTRHLIKTTRRNKQKHKAHVKRLNKKQNNRTSETFTNRPSTGQATRQNNTIHNRIIGRPTINNPTSTHQPTKSTTTLNPGRYNQHISQTPPDANIDNSIINDIQRQISNFLTPTHIKNYIQQTKRRNKPK